MTRRELMQAVVEGRQPERTPVCIRMDLWHNDCVSRDALPDEIKGRSCAEVEDHLGFARSSRYSIRPELKFRSFPAEISEPAEGETLESYRLPGRTLTRHSRRTRDMVRQGMGAHALTYPLQSEADYDAFMKCADDLYLDFSIADFDDFDRRVGDAGLPMLIAGPCPAHTLMLRFAGYESFFLHQADFQDKVDALIRTLTSIFQRDLWPAVSASSASLVLHGAHFSSQMTSPTLFEQHFVPYFTAFNALMHDQGKRVAWHADAEMGALLTHVLGAGFDMSDCLLSAPAIPQAVGDYFDAWQGRIACWGGLPSMVFDETHPLKDFEVYVRSLVDLTRERRDFIFGASDHVMPGAPWQRLVRLAELVS